MISKSYRHDRTCIRRETVSAEHPGDTIRALFPSWMTVGEAAQRLGIGRPALSRVLNGRAKLTPYLALKLEETFKADPFALLIQQARYELAEAIEEEEFWKS